MYLPFKELQASAIFSPPRTPKDLVALRSKMLHSHTTEYYDFAKISVWISHKGAKLSMPVNFEV